MIDRSLFHDSQANFTQWRLEFWCGLLVLWSCGAATVRHVPYDQLYQSEPAPVPHTCPREVTRSDWVSGYYNHSFAQLARLASPGFYLERELGGPEALDVNAFGKVPDSTWFTNRFGKQTLTPAAVLRGPNVDDGPALASLTVTKAKLDGVTPGFFLKDARGQRWLVKLDSPSYPEMNSGAEAISTKILYAAGYHVPQNHVVFFKPGQLRLAPDATMRDRYNRKVPFTRERLKSTVELLNPNENGEVRALFSRFIDGRPLGPFRLVGTRQDDPNDRVRHERRRSLRGLWVFYAWLNNTDAKVTNSFDSFITTEAQRSLGHVRHYLLDFGTSLGSAGRGVKLPAEGYDYLLDWERIGRRFFGLGLYYPYWVTVRRTQFRAVGIFESEVFQPAKWRPLYPNAGFEAADQHDTFWAAAIVAHMQRKHIEAAVAAGQFSEIGAAQWVIETLLQRRRKILKHAFRGLSALDDPEMGPHHHLHWTDLRQLGGLAPPGPGTYEWRWHWVNDARHTELKGIVTGSTLNLKPLLGKRPGGEQIGSTGESAILRLRRATNKPQQAGHPWLSVNLRVLPGNIVLPVGASRPFGASPNN